jgi:TrmH family RNA methyltransferase
MPERRDTIIVALDGVQDPGNVGTIVRLAAAFDCAGVALLPGCADPFAPKVIRSSVGAVLTVPIAAVSYDELVAAKLPLFAAALNGTSSQPPARGAIVVFGSEGGGVSPEITRAAEPITIPMSPRVESLNVATSAAILLSRSYELRQR